MATEVIEYQNNQPAAFGYVRDGIAGNYDVVHKMVRLVRDSVVLDKGLEDVAKSVLISKGLDAHSTTEDIFNTIYNFTRHYVKYIPDIQGKTESIKDARTTLNDNYGDCDDHAILNATLLAMLGYEPKFVIAKYDDSDISNFQHIYVVAYVNGERFVFDTTLPFGELNDEAATASKREIGIFDYSDEVDGVSGIIQGIKNLFQDTKHNAIDAVSAMSMSGVLPLGLLPAHALAAGASMFGATITDTYSLSELGSKTTGKLTDLIIQLDQRKIATQIARRYAKQYLADFYIQSQITKENEDSYKYIEKQILKKIAYIESYGTSGNSGAVSLNFSLMQILGIGAIGLTALYLFNKGK